MRVYNSVCILYKIWFNHVTLVLHQQVPSSFCTFKCDLFESGFYGSPIIIIIFQNKTFQSNQLENMLGPQRQTFITLLAKEYHNDMPWFHGKIAREDSEKIIRESRHQDGKFL